MSADSMNNHATFVNELTTERQTIVDIQQGENPTCTQANLEEIMMDISETDDCSTDATFLKHSFWSRHRTAKGVSAFALFTSLAMAVGVLVVCLTAPGAKGPICALVLKPTVQYSDRTSSRPQSVAVGDFNNDSCMDVVVANAGTDSVGVFFGNGSGIFSNQIKYSTGLGSAPQMVAVGDFNNDNQPDIAVANFGTNNIGILLGNWDGKFSSQTTAPTASSRPVCVAVGDFNNDKKLDILFGSYGTDSVGILLGFGDGNFTIQTTFPTGYDSFPHSIAVGDFNNDNKLDIAVANLGTNNVGVLLGYGNGTFAIETTYLTGANSHPYSILISHLNNDIHLDIAVVNSGKDNLIVLFGYGNGSFTLPTFYSTGTNSNPISIAVADLNNDNKPDITVANNGTSSVSVLFGYENGKFANPITYSTGPDSNPYSIALADFNNDNQLDIAVANQQSNNIMIFNGYREEMFANQIAYPINISSYLISVLLYETGDSSSPYSVIVGDFNNDNLVDILVANSGTNNVGVLLGYGDGTFSTQAVYSTGDGSSPYSVAVADFNNDSLVDIVVANYGSNNVGVLLGYGDGTFSNQVVYSTGDGSSPYSVAVGDFNNDSLVDIAVANSGSNNVGVLLGYGDGTFSNQAVYSTGDGSSPYSVAVGDFNNDSLADIIVANYYGNNVGVLLGYGNGTFSNQAVYSTGDGSSPHSVAVDDFNSDSLVDVAIANSGTNTVGVLLGYGNGTFSDQVVYSTGDGSSPYSVTVDDFNSDSLVDIAVANSGTNNVGVLLGYGNGTFSNQVVYSTGDGSSPYSVTVGNFNSDSLVDIAVANSGTNNVGVLLGLGNGTFPCTIDTQVLDSSASIAIADFNNDNRLDVVFVNSHTNYAGVFLGYGDGTFASKPVFTFTGCSGPMSIAVGDFNKDSLVDIVVANYLGNNVGVLLGYGNGTFSIQAVYSTGDSSSPYSVAVGDFNNDSLVDIVVANSGTNNVGVFIGYGNGRFSNQAVYFTGNGSGPHSVAVADFNNDNLMDIAVTNYNKFNVGIFVGCGDGTFRAQTTWSSGVYSFPVTLAVGDFNNDSNLDIAVDNSASNEEHILILLGNGNGEFSSKGKFITGRLSNPTSIVVGHFNNDSLLDFAVVNSGTNNFGIFLGHGDGTFSTQITYSTNSGSNPTSIAVGDFNRDSRTDVAIANNSPFTIGIFLAVSNTIFEIITTHSTGYAAHPRAIAINDFTNDGHFDIVVVNYATHSLGLLFNHGNGSFVMQTVYSGDFTFYPESIVVADFNNDSRLDLAVANSVADNVNLLFGDGNGAFGDYTAYSTGNGSKPQSIAIGDFNNDRRSDIVVAHAGTGSVGVLIRADSGAVENLKTYSTGSGSKPHGLAVGDFNSDGKLDIAVTNNGQANIGFFFGFGNGTFSNQSTISVGEGIFPIWVGVGDFNNDKRLDVVVADNISPAPVIVLLGNGDGSFLVKETRDGAGTASGGLGDFNNDGLLDLTLGVFYGSALVVYLGCGDGTFQNPTTYSPYTGARTQSIIVGDFNNDSQLDIAVANSVTNNVGILLGYGDGTFSDQVAYSTGYGSNPQSIAIGDFNKDSQLDIAVANSGTNNIAILFGYGNGTFSTATTYSTGDGSSPNCVTVGDFNNDDRLDIAVALYGTGQVGILLGHVNGTFFSTITYATGDNSNPYSVAFGNFNNDGRLDLTFSDMNGENIGVFLGYASESFINTADYPLGNSSQPVSIAVGDFTNDTHLDVVVADRGTNNVIILYGSGYGTFSSPANYTTGENSQPNSVAVGDFNNDNKLDIAVVNSGTNSICILLGHVNGTFSSPTTYSTGDFSSPLSLAVGNFDNDTQLDIAVAIFGSNSIGLFLGYGNGSFASPLFFTPGFNSHPFAVAFGDLNKDHSTDVVICNNGDSTIEILSKIC